MGDFLVNTESFRRVVGGHGKVRDDLSAVNRQGRALVRVQPPMEDPATAAFVAAAARVGQAHVDSVARIERDVRGRVEEMTATLDQYVRTEQGNNDKFRG